MINYINEIAQINKIDRFNAITQVLKDHKIDYIIQNISKECALGNIIVKSNDFKNKKIVVSAHYDNAPGTPGANDNAAACSILLNLIINNKNKNNNIEYVFFDLEEIGGIGSEYYVQLNKNNIDYAINLDMCGVGENIVYSHNSIQNINSHELSDLIEIYNVYRVFELPFSDAYSFINENIETFYIINSTNHDIRWFKNYPFCCEHDIPDFSFILHQPDDTVDKLNLIQIEKIFLFIKDLLEKYKK